MIDTHAFLQVFSAHAEVVPKSESIVTVICSILRACGGSSFSDIYWLATSQYSPRMRR